MDLQPGGDSGGHDHNLNDGTRPLILASKAFLFPLGAVLDVDGSGRNLTYTSPEISGTVDLIVIGKDQWGTTLGPASFTFTIQDPKAFQPLMVDGLTIVTKSHPNEGVYGTAEMQDAVSDMVNRYYVYAADAKIDNPDRLVSEAASMALGGLFDADWNGDVDGRILPWSQPHCGHRNGKTIDLSLSPFRGIKGQKERTVLKQAAIDAGFEFSARGERPQDKPATHWHAEIKK
jgi:hypothetical protein